MNDSNGKPIEANRFYVLSRGSACDVWQCIEKVDHPIASLSFYSKVRREYLSMEYVFEVCDGRWEGATIERLSDWTLRNNRESLLESLANIQERAAEANATLDALEREALELLHAGYTDESRDAILGFVRDRRGSPEEIAALVSAGS